MKTELKCTSLGKFVAIRCDELNQEGGLMVGASVERILDNIGSLGQFEHGNVRPDDFPWPTGWGLTLM